MAASVDAFGSPVPLSMLLRPVVEMSARFANSACVKPSMARAPRSVEALS